ncbi:MAG: hypothetical protein A2Z88_04350 [Omnitrophica WOR_2 bacterium GWA2_47_8]|nr:MAG: hypothetical protein A2Z88_04350 [Omnitrophica WOR_2 bacterium GWA2_47_8]
MDNLTEQTPASEKQEEKPFFSVIIHSFFIIPFLIAVFCVLLFAAVNLLTKEQQTAYDYLNNVKIGGITKRWQSAFELSKILANPKMIPADSRFYGEMISAFEQSRHDDSRVRQYLALAMGRTKQPQFFEPLVKDLDSEKEDNLYAIIYALGMLQDKRAVDYLVKYLDHPQARLRSGAVVALGSIGDPNSIKFLKKALNDPEPNVQWGSAISLAQMKDASGKEVIAKLLNRNYYKQFPEVDVHEQMYLMLAAIDAARFLKDPQLNSQIKELSSSETNMKVRAVALEYLNIKNK